MNYEEALWEDWYRFGLAGEGQADIIGSYLHRHKWRVLNIGCGPWNLHPYDHQITNLARHCQHLIAADNADQPRPAVCPRNVSLLMADASALPLTDESIDCILALGLFAYFPGPRMALTEFHRVCRPEGHLLFTNSVARSPKHKYRKLAIAAGFELVEEAEGYCRAVSENEKRRYMLVFVKPAQDLQT